MKSKTDKRSGIITASEVVIRSKLTAEPTMLVNIPTTIDDKNSRFSKENPSFSAKIY
jgi:hypothetical protein